MQQARSAGCRPDCRRRDARPARPACSAPAGRRPRSTMSSAMSSGALVTSVSSSTCSTHLLAAAQQLARRRLRAVQRHRAGLDPAAEPRARIIREHLGQSLVEPASCGGSAAPRLRAGSWSCRRSAGCGRFRLSCLFVQTSEFFPMRLSMGLSKLPMSKLPVLKVLAVLALAVSMSACSMFKSQAARPSTPCRWSAVQQGAWLAGERRLRRRRPRPTSA